MTSRRPTPAARRRSPARQRGAAAILAMMFLVIFGSLATAMAIVAHGNLRTADSHLKLNRSLSASESGMQLVSYVINEALTDPANADVFVRPEGEIDDTIANEMWATLKVELVDRFSMITPDGFPLPTADPEVPDAIRIGPIPIGAYQDAAPDASIPVFVAIITPHPIVADSTGDEHPLHGHSYDSSFYDRAPYDGSSPTSGITAPVTSTNPLGPQWIRVKVIGIDGKRDAYDNPVPSKAVSRSISQDFRIEKRIRAAVLSKSRVMIGRNVMIEGRIGSLFNEVHLDNGHPIQMESDFRGLDATLDAAIDTFVNDYLTPDDADGDNRIHLATEAPSGYLADLAAVDAAGDGDGYADEFDLFVAHFDTDGNGEVSATELGASADINAAQLLELIDTFGNGNGVIDADDRYAKVRGEVVIKAAQADWEAGAAYNDSDPGASTYRDYFSGPLHPNHDEAPLTFEADESEFPTFDQHSFEGTAADLTSYATQDVYAQAAAAEPYNGTPEIGANVVEPVPFGAAYPYDFYERQVFRNMTFHNARIPRGCNALFENCRFTGVTYIETTSYNSTSDGFSHPTIPGANAYNYSGMQEADGSYKHPDIDAAVEDEVKAIDPSASTTKDLSNNLRFHNCRFEGGIISGDGGSGAQPNDFSHTRNKLTFTGDTTFADVTDPTQTPTLTAELRDKLRRGTIIAPHFSVEMGTFKDPYSSTETVELNGTVVAGVFDMRGQIRIDGTILTTFEPVSNSGPVLGDTSPQFNTTLGYFSSEAGDLEAELPPDGVGVIQVRYNPNLPLPDGVRARVSIEALPSTYYEGGFAEPGVYE